MEIFRRIEPEIDPDRRATKSKIELGPYITRIEVNLALDALEQALADRETDHPPSVDSQNRPLIDG